MAPSPDRSLRSNDTRNRIAKSSPSRTGTTTTSSNAVSTSSSSGGSKRKKKAKKTLKSPNNDHDSANDIDIDVIDDSDDSSIEEETEQGRRKVVKRYNDETVASNKYEKSFITLTTRKGEGITSPCWTSKLVKIARMNKEGAKLVETVEG